MSKLAKYVWIFEILLFIIIMPAKTFADFTRQVHLLNDLILADMIYVSDDYAEESMNFKKHLLATKYWFTRISWANKRRYLLALLQDLRSAWALSLFLKSVWNCRPKDAVYSVAEPRALCSFDRVPVDHNRTAQPVKTLSQVMTNDRKWFHTLDPESQAMVLAELVTAGGGPLMWEMTHRAQVIYERYRDHQLKSLLECIVVSPPQDAKKSPTEPLTKSSRSDDAATAAASQFSGGVGVGKGSDSNSPLANAQKQLENAMAAWNSAIKAIRDSQKLDEVEMTFDDGTKRKIWKVNRLKPEGIETVDFVQLLPSSIGKHILSYLPASQLGEYAKVNKYWAYLVDELRAEWTARGKINNDLDKLKEMMLKHDSSLDVLAPCHGIAASSLGASVAPSLRVHLQVAPSMRPSEKSGFSYKFAYDKLKPNRRTKQKPIRNMAELSDRLETRGAVDDNLWTWCRNVLKDRQAGSIGPCVRSDGRIMTLQPATTKAEEGVMRFGNAHFPCPMMKHSIAVPLPTPLLKDPSVSTAVPPRLKHNISSWSMLAAPKEPKGKRFSLWSRDFSSLYKVFKVASYQSPV